MFDFNPDALAISAGFGLLAIICAVGVACGFYCDVRNRGDAVEVFSVICASLGIISLAVSVFAGFAANTLFGLLELLGLVGAPIAIVSGLFLFMALRDKGAKS